MPNAVQHFHKKKKANSYRLKWCRNIDPKEFEVPTSIGKCLNKI